MFKSLKSGHARTNVYNKSAKIRILQKTKPQSNGLLRMYYLYSLSVCVCVFSLLDVLLSLNMTKNNIQVITKLSRSCEQNRNESVLSLTVYESSVFFVPLIFFPTCIAAWE